MKILASFALLAIFALTGCVVVPAEPAVVVGPPRAYINPPSVVVVPARPYYGYGYYGHGRYRYRPYY